MSDTQPTLTDVMRRLDAIDRDLLSIDRRFNATDATLDMLTTMQSDFRKETLSGLNTLLDAIADIGKSLQAHREEGH